MISARQLVLEVPNMSFQASQLTLGLLPEHRTRWGKFVLSYGVQSLIVAFCLIAAIMYPDVLEPRERDYHFVSLVSTPPPTPQAPAPVRNFPVPKIVEPVTPRPEAMRVPPELVRKKPDVPEEQAPKVTLAAKKKEILPEIKPEDPSAAGQDQRVLRRKFSHANHGGGSAKGTNRRFRRSEWRARV
jgi:hypothetical protein